MVLILDPAKGWGYLENWTFWPSHPPREDYHRQHNEELRGAWPTPKGPAANALHEPARCVVLNPRPQKPCVPHLGKEA